MMPMNTHPQLTGAVARVSNFEQQGEYAVPAIHACNSPTWMPPLAASAEGSARLAGLARTHAYAGNREWAATAQTFEPTASACPGQGDGSNTMRVLYAPDIGEAMGALENLWLRLARHPAIRVAVQAESKSDAHHVQFRVVRRRLDGECLQLLHAAADANSYRWHQGNSRGSLVSTAQWMDTTLVVALVSSARMRRWPLGDALTLAMQALLCRMQQLGARA